MTKNNLKAPLSFQGGKQRIGNRIADIILSQGESDVDFIDLCCGSGAVSISMNNAGVPLKNITMVDSSDWGQFWNQVSTESFDMDYFEYLIESIPADVGSIQQCLKDWSKDSDIMAESLDLVPMWLLLQAGSFGGKQISRDWENNKWKNASFRSYWQPTETSSRRSPVNPMMPMPSTLEKNIKLVVDNMADVNAYWLDVLQFDFSKFNESLRKSGRVVVFIDPPYKNTTGYNYNFDYHSFVKDFPKEEGYELYITDYKKHSDMFWEFGHTSKGGISGATKKRQEIMSRVF